MLLGYIVSQRGIEANPEKVAALERMGPIRDLKRVQKVLGCLAALSRFISRLGEKGLPLYQLLKKHERFSWTVEAQEALDKLKATLAHAPILTPPQDGEPLYLYVAATTQVVSAVIVVERTKEGMPYQSSGRYTTSTRYCPRPRCAIRKSRSCSTQWSLRGASSATISRLTQSRWSPPFHWERSSETRMQQAGLPSGR
jgi:hypothetical protein